MLRAIHSFMGFAYKRFYGPAGESPTVREGSAVCRSSRPPHGQAFALLANCLQPASVFGGGVWESNPPGPALATPQTVLKTAPITGRVSPPRIFFAPKRAVKGLG